MGSPVNSIKRTNSILPFVNFSYPVVDRADGFRFVLVNWCCSSRVPSMSFWNDYSSEARRADETMTMSNRSRNDSVSPSAFLIL